MMMIGNSLLTILRKLMSQMKMVPNLQMKTKKGEEIKDIGNIPEGKEIKDMRKTK